MVKNKKLFSDFTKNRKTSFPSLAELEQVKERIKYFPNQKGEFKRKTHYGCFLLCSESGLRISEAVEFDLKTRTKKGLYRISKCKGRKERYVYVSKEVIWELKKQNWKPNQTNRFAFYHFLRKIKQEASINQNVELTPHTLRRAFTTYHAENGTPLPLLQKFLGHSSIRTTALYWQNIHGKDDLRDILSGKKWLEKAKKPKPPAEVVAPSQGILPTNLEPLTTEPAETVQTIKTSSPPIEKKSLIQPKLIGEISPKSPKPVIENFSGQLPLISKKKLNEKELLLARIKELEQKLKQVQVENNSLKLENQHLKALIGKEQQAEIEQIKLLKWKN